MIGLLLEDFDSKVPAAGMFPDHRVSEPYPFEGESGPLGRLELAVVAMDPRRDPSFDTVRYVALRVKKSPKGGVASISCMHGTAAEVKARLEGEARRAVYLSERATELAEGLPEETDPEMWR